MRHSIAGMYKLAYRKALTTHERVADVLLVEISSSRASAWLTTAIPDYDFYRTFVEHSYFCIRDMHGSHGDRVKSNYEIVKSVWKISLGLSSEPLTPTKAMKRLDLCHVIVSTFGEMDIVWRATPAVCQSVWMSKGLEAGHGVNALAALIAFVFSGSVLC